MKLDEAIKIAEHYDDTFQTYTVTMRHRAVKLLIEAGKSRQHHRRFDNHPDQELLPGETKE